MSQHSQIMPIVERLLEEGIEDRDAIVATVMAEVDVDESEMRHTFFTKAVSFALSNIRDDMGRRLVYQVREGGKHIAVHLTRTTDAALVRKIGQQKRNTGKALIAEGDRLITIAEQIEMNFGAAA